MYGHCKPIFDITGGTFVVNGLTAYLDLNIIYIIQ